jgi:hypothetical protein
MTPHQLQRLFIAEWYDRTIEKDEFKGAGKPRSLPVSSYCSRNRLPGLTKAT